MAKQLDKLIIVESPAKAGTIKKFLGTNVKVIASKGHIRDLPKSRIGVEPEKDFEIEYINVRGKGDLIKELKKEAKNAKKVYLATDPDREGEAIAWHIGHILEIPIEEKARITFNEITEHAVKEAVKNPRYIDKNLVDAQQARRVLDRIVGYKVSPMLWKKIQSGLSAGRVQSATLKIIIDRENEIRNFKSEEYWNIYVTLKTEKSETFIAKLFSVDGETKNNKLEISNEKQVEEIIKSLNSGKYVVEEIIKKDKQKNPPPPFTTSTLQQSSARALNFNIKKTMQVAQKLYEGIKIPKKGNTGLITYMRTDSTRISEQARKAAKETIISKYGDQYFCERFFKTSKKSQDGHEAIRPTYLDLTPESIKEYLTVDEYKLYNLIYKRFLASQMSNAVYDTMTIKIKNNKNDLRANGSTLKFDGFLTLYDLKKYNNVQKEEKAEDNQEELVEEQENLPVLTVGEEVYKEKIKPVQSFTKPPARYTEASLVKVLEKFGIGRPSTYSPTINTIIQRRYIKRDKKQLVPTELGEIVNNVLIENFQELFQTNFTAQIEEDFDKIASGEINWKQTMQEFYNKFITLYNEAFQKIEKITIEAEKSDILCPNCNVNLIYKKGRFGTFLACPNYPTCKHTERIVDYIREKCPNCGGRIEKRKSAKTRKLYYICENNPKNNCEYISWEKPVYKTEKSKQENEDKNE